MIVGLIQPLVGEQKEENLNQILVQIESAVVEGQANLVILPELWNTPFINGKILEHQDEWSFMMDALCQRAKELGVWIVAGSLPCKKNGHLYNTCAIIDANGKIAATPSKTHLLEVHTSKHTYRQRESPGVKTSLSRYV